MGIAIGIVLLVIGAGVATPVLVKHRRKIKKQIEEQEQKAREEKAEQELAEINRKEREQEKREQIEKLDKIQKMVTQLLEQILDINILIRTTLGFSLEAVETIETLLDLLKDLIPETYNRYPEEQVTREVSKVVTFHLPSLLNPFTNLSSPDRIANQARLISVVKDRIAEVSQVAEFIRQNQVKNFNTDWNQDWNL